MSVAMIPDPARLFPMPYPILQVRPFLLNLPIQIFTVDFEPSFFKMVHDIVNRHLLALGLLNEMGGIEVLA